MRLLRPTLSALSLFALMLAASGAAAKTLEPLVVGSENVIRPQWQTAQHRGRTVLSVLNDSMYAITRVQLLVEGLDREGAVVSQTVTWLGDDVDASAKTFFEVPAPGPAAGYRVRVFAFDRLEDVKG